MVFWANFYAGLDWGITGNALTTITTTDVVVVPYQMIFFLRHVIMILMALPFVREVCVVL